MAVSPRIIRRRLRSVKSTGKIMKAMELVAASKMRRAVQLAVAGRPYAESLTQLTFGLIDQQGEEKVIHPYLKQLADATSGKTWMIVFASDRGLCGGFNTQIGRSTLESLSSFPKDQVEVVTVGGKAERFVRNAGYHIRASFPAFSQNTSLEKLRPLLRYIQEGFLAGEVDRVMMSFMQFKSALVQNPRVEQVLPVKLSTSKELPTTIKLTFPDKLIEPSVSVLLAALLPRYADARLYQAALESAASEHSARMMAMRSAGDAAKDMADGLTLSLNQARQAAITREISEISAGKAALSA